MIRAFAKIALVILFSFGIGVSVLKAQRPEDFTLDVCATTELLSSDTTRTVVRIKWSSGPTTPLSLNYRYKAKNDAFWSSPPTTLTTTDTCIIDTIPTGTEREYQIVADTSGAMFDYLKYGNILVGRKVPAVLSHGRLLVLIDSVYLGAIDSALDVYKHDLIGDGFIPVFQYVSRTNTVTAIKQHIVNAYNITSSALFGVVLLGNIPVPYSGNFDGSGVGFFPPDGHTTTSAPPSHEGAWATDLYYGDMSASTLWTDATVTNTAGARAANNNTIGDGKFDQTATPSAIEIPIGRVDLTNLPIFPESDTLLVIRYLTKNHNYRAAISNVRGRLLQDDELRLITGEPFGGNSFQIANPIWGDSVSKLDWNSTLQTNSYQWAQGFGFGSYSNCVNVVSSANFAANTYQATFTSLFGSYFGDFDISNNLLRSALASKGEILTTVWSGRPKWYFHQMGTGNPIGLSVKNSQNTWNGTYLVYPDALYGAGLVHQSFHGDVSLKLDPYQKPNNFVVRQDSCNNRFILSWDHHPDADVIGYTVQRTDALDSSFTDLIVNTTDSFYIDSFPNSGTNYYMVRAIKPQENCSGMHYNLSHGAIDSIARITEPPVFAGNDTSVCENELLTLGTNFMYDSNLGFLWSPGALLLDSSLQQPAWTANQSQSFIMSVFDSSSFCTSMDTVAITVNIYPIDTIQPPNSLNGCGDTATITASTNGSGNIYSWEFASGTPAVATGVGAHQIVWSGAGYNQVKMIATTAGTTCSISDSIQHYVPNTEVFAGRDSTVCPGQLVPLGSSYSYDTAVVLLWSPSALLTDSSQAQQTWLATQMQQFVLRAHDTLSTCFVYDTVIINTLSSPEDTISAPISNACGDTISIQGSSNGLGKSYTWTFPSGSPATVAGNGMVGPHDVTWAMASSYSIVMEVTDNVTSCIALDSILHSVACVLPIDLLDFDPSYKANCKTLDVTWITANEINVNGYYLKLFSKGVLVNTVFVKSKEQNTSSTNLYSQSLNVESEVDEVRLLELDFNNVTTLYAQKAVFASNCETKLNVYPNPYYLGSSDMLKISGTKNVNELSIYNSMGTRILTKQWDKNKESIELYLQGKLNPGAYLLRIGKQSLKLVVY